MMLIKPCKKCNNPNATFWTGQSQCTDCDKAYKTARRDHYLQLWREHQKAWSAANPDKAKAKWDAYQARLKAAPGNLSALVIKEVYAIYGRKCLKCGATSNLSIDHVVPLSKGGTNCLDNLQPLCVSCNAGKGDTVADYRPVECPF